MLKRYPHQLQDTSIHITEFHHVKAHQDDCITFYYLVLQPEQLSNCYVDTAAKKAIQEADMATIPKHTCFYLEKIVCFVGKEKMTSDTTNSIHYWAHMRIARDTLSDEKIYGQNNLTK